MTNLKKIVGFNLAILLLYMVWARLSSTSFDGLDMIVTAAFAIILHVSANLAVATFWFFRNRRELGKSYLLSAGIVLLVGFSTCLGTSVI